MGRLQSFFSEKHEKRYIKMETTKNWLIQEASLKVKHSVVGFASAVTPLLWTFLEPEENFVIICYRLSICLILTIIFGRFIFPNYFDVWWRAVVTGFGASIGIFIIISPNLQVIWPFGTYLCILATFHFLEYVVTGITNPSNLSTDSFLLNHSLQYWIAAIASWIEFFVEFYFLPEGFKSVSSLVLFGVLICIVGDVLRKMAMFHAGNSFCHIVQSSKREDHVLVTSGVFSYVRHPSYVGWFLWSLGTQIVLLNPICLILYGVVSWLFFNERIYIEEHSLLRFFGNDYSDYQKKVPSGIPFVRGFLIDKDL